MPRLTLLFFGAIALLAAFPAAASDAAWSGYKWATVDVDDSGRIVAIELESDLTPGLAAALRHEIATWAFEPALLDGAPVASKTHLGLHLRAHDRGAGLAGVELVAVSNGPRSVDTQRTRYPEDALRRRIEGAVMLTLTVMPDGSVADVVGDENSHPLLRRAAVRSARAWAFLPEQVAGQPVATRVKMPVAFCIPTDGRPCVAPLSHPGVGAPARHPDQLTALDSPLRLKADPGGRLIGSRSLAPSAEVDDGA